MSAETTWERHEPLRFAQDRIHPRADAAKHGDWINQLLKIVFVLALALLLGTLVWLADNGAEMWPRMPRLQYIEAGEAEGSLANLTSLAGFLASTGEDRSATCGALH